MPSKIKVPKSAQVITKVQGYEYLGAVYPTLKEAQAIATKNKIGSLLRFSG